MGQEYERKYRLTEDQARSIQQDLGPWSRMEMETTYYDTPDRVLSARHWTLRRRMENGVPVCTLKTPMAGICRGEWETECADISQAVPALIALGCPRELEALTKDGVEPLCGACFVRLYHQISSHGAQVELALDRGVLLGGHRHMGLLEFEIELKDGTQTQADEAAGALAREYGLVPEGRSKFRRALALAEGE